MHVFTRTYAFLLATTLIYLPAAALDLTEATIVVHGEDPVIHQAVTMLQEELAERSGISLPVSDVAPSAGTAIHLGTRGHFPDVTVPEHPEAYAIAVSEGTVTLAGYDARGALYAAGRLIRLADYGPGTLTLDLPEPIATAPDVPLRAHQLAYRNTANTYDAWSLETYEQYIRDLVIFGCNGIELITSLDPNARSGQVMTQSTRAMNLKLAALIDSYGLDVWLWSPVMADGEEDVTTPEGLAQGLEKRRAFLAEYPAIDHVFVPGGDDGDTPAEYLVPFLEGLAPLLAEAHPGAKLWVSNQTFTLEENDYFFDYLATARPAWLHGLVYGPWVKMGWEEMRDRTPADYPIRRYPDINHTVRCQYPIPNWDPIWANTAGREPMMPMPEMQRHIYRRYLDVSDGFGTYSDGVHDDLNKHVWNVLGWNPDSDLDRALEEYGKVWFGPELARDVARGLRLFEANWTVPISTNKTIPEALALWESIARRVRDYDNNWRAQMYLFRARFDAYVHDQAHAHARYEQEAHAALAQASDVGVPTAIQRARDALAQADTPANPELRAGIEALGPVLLESIGYQLSIKAPYFARNTERGALLDWLDQPLNDRPWLEQRFDEILTMTDPVAQLIAVEEILHWTDPGPGGFYDNLGTSGAFSRVVYQRSWEGDPSGNHTARVAFPRYQADQATIRAETPQTEASNMVFKGEADRLKGKYTGRQELRMSWQSQITTLYGTPLKMRYTDLDPDAQYRLKVTYAGRFRPSMTLTVDDAYGIHGPVPQPDPIWPVTYFIPRAATEDGTLEVEWNLVEGRGCMVAEVWLIRTGPSGTDQRPIP